MTHLTYLEAAVVGLVQGVSELFPVSSLGHNVLIPALIGGQWAADLNVSKPESPYLAFIVGLHVATAIALLVYFWRDWVRIASGFLSSVRERRVETADQRLAWMIVLATIPVGLVGLVAEHPFRLIFGKPVVAGAFLAVNGVILIAGERFRSRASLDADARIAAGRRLEPVVAVGGRVAPAPAAAAVGPGLAAYPPAVAASPVTAQSVSVPSPSVPPAGVMADRRLSAMRYGRAIVIGSAQILALLAGISRDGVTMVAGMRRGLAREDAARFAFLLSTPVILAAGVLKIPDLFGPLGSGIRGQILLGSVLSGLGAYAAVRFLVRYLRTRSLVPFGIYCLVAGLASVVYLSLAG
ncbi:MAG TPA: undecaprenyl-diphosphate phosphatase [Streptosporangiaceae bacterium]|nr:undecaprenyl-diphosphate phosphatase [Streptosporangiaceae bacterium]